MLFDNIYFFFTTEISSIFRPSSCSSEDGVIAETAVAK